MMPRYSQMRSTKRRRGSILLISLVAIVLLSLTAYTFTAMMLVEEESARLLTRQVQSKYLVDSGVDYARLFLTNDEDTIREKGGIWDNESDRGFKGVPVGVDPADPTMIGRFTILAPNINDDGIPEGFRYGLVDESTKLNVNTLIFADNNVENGGRQLLMALPNMTEEIADAIMDWIDPDEEIRDYGTESNYYAQQNPGYQCKNGPLDSLDELLLVRGVTPQLLFGLDTNRNGLLDDNEMQGENISGIESDMFLGWINYLTLYSKESNLTEDGLPRINLNNPELGTLYTDLRASLNEDWSKFIIQYRLTGPYFIQEDDELDPDALRNLELPEDLDSAEGQFTYDQILDLVDVYTQTDDGVIIPSPVTMATIRQTLPILLTNTTTYEGDSIPGRINLQQAPRQIILGVPGMTEELADTVLYYREEELDDPNLTDLPKKFGAWLLLDGHTDLATMRTMYPYVCGGGDVYSAEVVGFYDDNVGTSRAEVIIDTTVPIPRILFWRDKSHLQAGYRIDTLTQDYIED